MSLNLSLLLETTARTQADRDAVVLGDVRFTYEEVDRRANQVANLLASRGVRAGTKVALSCPNVPMFAIAYYGILKTGAVVVPLNVLLKRDEIAYHLRDSEAVAFVCFEGTAELPTGVEGTAAFDEVPACSNLFVVPSHSGDAAQGVEATRFLDALAGQPDTFRSACTSADDTAVILYTSGTTGQPKGAELTHANMVLNALACNQLFDSSPAGHDRHAVVLPLFHSFGQTVNLNAGFAVGATLVMIPRFEATRALELMASHEITVFAGVPTMYWGLLGAAEETTVDIGRVAGSLRKAISGGSALPVDILRRVQQTFGVQVLEGYGLSETSPVATFSDPGSAPRPGSIGVPLWGVEVKLVEPAEAAEWIDVDGPDRVGEVAIRGHNVMKGYYNRPEATAEVLRDGWFRTGDLARRDEDGWYYVVDRSKDLIIRGGFNVYPREVEEVLMTHEAVSLAAVVGEPDDSHGEEIAAYVILQPGFATAPDELVSWCKQRMAAYKYPRRVVVVESLPMTSTGKILKRELAHRGRP